MPRLVLISTHISTNSNGLQCLCLIKNFNSDTNKSYFTNKFSWIKDYVLSVRKLTKEEWERFINFEISRLDNKYQKQRSKLLDKKNQYK